VEAIQPKPRLATFEISGSRLEVNGRKSLFCQKFWPSSGAVARLENFLGDLYIAFWAEPGKAPPSRVKLSTAQQAQQSTA